MATFKIKGKPFNTNGSLPNVGADSPEFQFVKTDLSILDYNSLKGQNVILNIFPSIDTSTCATSVRKFNEKAAGLENTTVLCVSKDLPFALHRFCGAEGIDKVHAVSDFRDLGFSKDFGLQITDGPLAGLLARAVVVIDGNGKVKHSELVSEVVDEPNYEAALNAL
jgi:thioredoxin-dependent peroxiredoxin